MMNNNILLIPKLLNQIVDKKQLREDIAQRVFLRPDTIANHWFSGHVTVPVKYQSVVVEILKQTLVKQIKVQTKLLKETTSL